MGLVGVLLKYVMNLQMFEMAVLVAALPTGRLDPLLNLCMGFRSGVSMNQVLSTVRQSGSDR